MHAAGDPDNRRPLPPRSTWDAERHAFVASLCALRRDEPALTDGRYVSLAQPGTGLVAFARVTDRPDETLLFVANATPRPLARTLFVAAADACSTRCPCTTCSMDLRHPAPCKAARCP